MIPIQTYYLAIEIQDVEMMRQILKFARTKLRTGTPQNATVNSWLKSLNGPSAFCDRCGRIADGRHGARCSQNHCDGVFRNKPILEEGK